MRSKTIPAGDAVWIATASMHMQHPSKPAFAVSEIVEAATKQHLFQGKELTIYLHANQHCVANRPPKNARLCMLTETTDGLRRLFHDGDRIDPHRIGARRLPPPQILPHNFRHLLTWYEDWNRQQAQLDAPPDPLLALVGTWTFGSAEEYLREIRDGWEGRP